MKLCLITYHTLVKENDRWLVDERFGRLIDRLAPYCDDIFFVASVHSGTEKIRSDDGRSIYEYAIQSPNVRIVCVESSSTRTPLAQKLLVALRRMPTYAPYVQRADFVYITLPGFSGILAHSLCRLLRKPYCLYFGSDWQEVAQFQVTWRGLNKLLFAPYVWLSKVTETSAVRHARFTVVHGKKVFEKFQKFNTPIVETIPLVLVKPEHFFRRDDTCQSDAIRCLYVGSVTPRKGVDYLIEACQILREKKIPVRLQIVGSGEHTYEQYIRDQVQQRGLEAYVEFQGYVADVAKLLTFYRQADLFVLPSQGEGFPRVIYEAMSQGLPVIATQIQTLQSVLTDHEQALLVTPRSAPALAQAIQELVENCELRRGLICHGYAFAYQKLGQGEAAQQLLDLMEKYGAML